MGREARTLGKGEELRFQRHVLPAEIGVGAQGIGTDFQLVFHIHQKEQFLVAGHKIQVGMGPERPFTGQYEVAAALCHAHAAFFPGRLQRVAFAGHFPRERAQRVGVQGGVGNAAHAQCFFQKGCQYLFFVVAGSDKEGFSFKHSFQLAYALLRAQK